MIKKYVLFLCMALIANTLFAQEKKVAQWDIFELSLKGPETGNPFVGISLKGVFKRGDKIYEPEGFYDGNGIYKIRCMPDEEGVWTYETHSNQEALDGIQGTFICTAPATANHGPVRVSNQYHFSYADGTPFYPFGTTIYEWVFQSEEKRKQTLETLKQSPFNKVRFLAIPPYNERYVHGPDSLKHFPFEGNNKENWDFSRFNPDFFQQLEVCIKQLRDMGVQADLILFRPYDGGKWGFDTMTDAVNERFVRYMVARFAAYHNIWWSMANENSFMENLTDEDWDCLFQLVEAKDSYHHLRSIHNAGRIYDYAKPWVTHVSLQYYNAVRAMGVSPLLRDIYKKPIVHDEINYEGNIAKRWGQLSGEEMTYRFWVAYIGGAYATHGEAIEGGWLSNGGTLQGESPTRIAFLKKIVENGPEEGLNPIDQYYLTNVAGKYGEYYLYYFGKEEPREWAFVLPDEDLKPGMRFKVEVIDTWNMTITPVDRVFEIEKLDNYKFVDKGRGKVKLPKKPYIAIRIQRIDANQTAQQ